MYPELCVLKHISHCKTRQKRGFKNVQITVRETDYDVKEKEKHPTEQRERKKNKNKKKKINNKTSHLILIHNVKEYIKFNSYRMVGTPVSTINTRTT